MRTPRPMIADLLWRLGGRILGLSAAMTTAVLLLAGCSYHLGYPQPQAGVSAGDQAIAHAECREKALALSDSVAYRARQFAIGLTLIGGPIGQMIEREDQRDVFTECMTAKGFRVVRATD